MRNAKSSKHHNITLSLPQELISDLHFFVKKRGISEFVREAIQEKLRCKKSSLEQQYMDAAQDEERNQFFQDWNSLSGDGLSEENSW